MKKTIETIRIATIALWPIVFLLVIGAIERNIRLRVSMSFQPYPNLWLVLVYIVSGCTFAFNMLCSEEFIRQKRAVYAYVFSAVSVILFCLLWVATLFSTPGGLFSPAAAIDILWVPIGVSFLILGLTIFAAVRAILLHKKVVD
ncbi:MAG: hypothetical protein FWE08_01315 [Oscillospiraceae bacterium]|nr:hypothetical protein [Oscillospiraceae bacterium]